MEESHEFVVDSQPVETNYRKYEEESRSRCETESVKCELRGWPPSAAFIADLEAVAE